MNEQSKGKSNAGGRAMAGEIVNVTVTPKIRQGNNIFCEIGRGQATGGNRVSGGVIKLPPGGPYTVNFALQPGDTPNLAWSPDQGGVCTAFWSAAVGCPEAGQDSQVTVPPVANGNTVTLQITPNPAQGRNVVHYALNFDQTGVGPGQFDPIIVVG